VRHRTAAAAALLAAASLGAAAAGGEARAPGVKSVTLPARAQPFFAILSGPPETASMESGLVTLEPGKSAGVHDTGEYEEIVVPLAGEGELRVPGRPALPLAKGVVAYSPPGTSHDVVNTGKAALTYIFVAARAR